MVAVLTYTCPNCTDMDDTVELEADFWAVKRGATTTHTCPCCGYSEER